MLVQPLEILPTGSNSELLGFPGLMQSGVVLLNTAVHQTLHATLHGPLLA